MMNMCNNSPAPALPSLKGKVTTFRSRTALSALTRHSRPREDVSLEAYEEFLKSKVSLSGDDGFTISYDEISPLLKPHQKDVVWWAIKGGRRAIFASFGLGKSIIQIEILRLILKKAGHGRALIVAPLGVRQEFIRDGRNLLNLDITFVRSMEDVRQRELFSSGSQIFITNYETVRDGKLDPANFLVTTLDEAACLRGFGGSKTFREFMRLFEQVRYRFVATATPDPNEFIEMLAYSAYLGVMDVSQAKTRFFKRNSTNADKLTLHPHKEAEFWLWVSSWAMFLQKPSDLGHSDEGYALPPLKVIHHLVSYDQSAVAGVERNGQMRMYPDDKLGVSSAAREKRDSLTARISKAKEIVDGSPSDHFLLWHDLEPEREALEKAIPEIVTIYGSQPLDEREQRVIDFSDGKFRLFGTKPVLSGAGCNLQRHCHKAIFVGIGFKFHDFIQAVHRLYRFLQTSQVEIHLICAESEKAILQKLLAKWEKHNQRAEIMSKIIQENGLSQAAMMERMTRALGVERVEEGGPNYRLVNNDCIRETRLMASDSVGLILTSPPFSSMYEYSPNYADFGHSESNAQFFEQMDFLTPELFRVLMTGRILAVHVKDRIVPGGMTGLGFQASYPFHVDCYHHYTAHGFAYLGMKTIVTDVVRENNQTYRLGWTEQCKDGTKMGVGMPEYLLLFRKPPTDTSDGYADLPVVKDKEKYSRSRWQIDAHGFARSSGDRPLSPADLEGVKHDVMFRMYRRHSLDKVYDHEHHVRLGESLEQGGRLPVTFMLLQPQSWNSEVWTDITRMRTLNAAQAGKGAQTHLCPLQLDIAERVIWQMSNPGEIVFDPFAGLGTVPMMAVKLGRQGWGVELSPTYYKEALGYLSAAARKQDLPTLFSLLEAETETETENEFMAGELSPNADLMEAQAASI